MRQHLQHHPHTFTLTDQEEYFALALVIPQTYVSFTLQHSSEMYLGIKNNIVDYDLLKSSNNPDMIQQGILSIFFDDTHLSLLSTVDLSFSLAMLENVLIYTVVQQCTIN